jgi:alpha-D-ribose 1-methylphosphonate 5-triphosphate synthase subunit PhnH
MTGAPSVPPEEADYVLCASIPGFDHMRALKTGDLLRPEDSATLLIWLGSEISGKRGVVRLSGPGVDSSYLLHVSDPLLQLIKTRGVFHFEYPMGFELFVVGVDGSLLGVPRTTSLQIIAEL